MDAGAAAWLVILLALAGANLPFLNDRLFAVVPLKSSGTATGKPFLLRLVELVVLFFIVGSVGRLLEGRIGTVFPQTWEFYAIGACLFVVLAFPGFVVRYLRKRH
ncbi:DUF2818 family protein [Pseudoduganella armeniaca]|uniref:DUF2818 domain-containing protein n=1 Tax=Pseudoduganella armeniaca TaxID=2072590 RepID=A0A2R4CDL4_9BURK|nr:DUF2818 family protein [Pseudoduganella armeniaca]AVR97744.1 DUF2818 domain-containing protein [Pseudoduganella armeniaca]